MLYVELFPILVEMMAIIPGRQSQSILYEQKQFDGAFRIDSASLCNLISNKYL